MKITQITATCTAILLCGCTATHKYQGPDYVFSTQDHKTNVKMSAYWSMKDSSKNNFTVQPVCNQSESVHSPIIWLPLIGPSIDLLLVKSPAELSWNDAWSYLPFAGPPATYVFGTQNCLYSGLTITKGDESLSPTENVSADLISEAIAVSDANCMAYQHQMEAGFNELDANQKFISDSATVTQTGAAFANPVAGAVMGGLKQVVSSGNDAIKSTFFKDFGLPQIFKNVWSNRKILIEELSPSDGESKKSKWGFSPENGMKYGALQQFMTTYDKTCRFEQAVSNLRETVDQGQADLKNTTAGDDSRGDSKKQEKAAGAKEKSKDQSASKAQPLPPLLADKPPQLLQLQELKAFRKRMLINNGANPL